MKMNKFRCLVLGVYAFAVLIGGWTANQVANGACEFGCKRVGTWTTKMYAGDMVGKEYTITQADICRRIWHSDPKDDNYAGLDTETKKYVQVLSSCTIACYSNGQVDGEASSGANPMLDSTETNITCHKICQPNPPMPGGP